MTQAAQLFPDVYFEHVIPQPADTLPRMDIAGFVGFAASGPVNVPVPIETPARFREIFGDDLALAWNDEEGRMEMSQLGLAVESFFRNSGRRCWVVRVAERPATHCIPFHGVVSALPTGATQFDLDARSPGDWALPIGLSTVLQPIQLGLERSEDRSEPAVVVNASGWTIDVRWSPDDLAHGDLIRLIVDEQTSLLLIVDQAVEYRGGIRLSGARGFWRTLEPVRSPPATHGFQEPGQDFDADPIARLMSLQEADSLGRTLRWAPPGSPPENRPRVQLLRFEMLIWRGDAVEQRLSNLAFNAPHPRFWGYLPTDAELFGSTNTGLSTLPQGAEILAAEVSQPRIPFAGTGASSDTRAIADSQDGTTADDEVFLPASMSSAIDRDKIAFPNECSASERSGREGLVRYGAHLFVDQALSNLSTDALLSEAKSRAILAPNPVPLEGIHSLTFNDEVTLISVPDALHAVWDRIPAPLDTPLAAPTLVEVTVTDDGSEVCLGWTAVDGASSFVVQRAESPEFESAQSFEVKGDVLERVGRLEDLLPPPPTELKISLTPDCRGDTYFRVRALRGGDASAWSNTRVSLLPPSDFLDCAATDSSELELRLSSQPVTSPPQGTQFTWERDVPSGPPASLTNADRFELQQSPNVEFTSMRTLHSSAALEFVHDEPAVSVFYYRVRAWRGNVAGPWSNTVRLPPTIRSQLTLRSLGEFSSDNVIGVQRALLRLCAARGDLLALLSAPRHYRQQDILDHVTLLRTPGGSATSSVNADGDNVTVPALTFGERRVFSYGAVYFPWLVISSGADVPRTVPPDGVASGAIARRTLEEGAWIAPANDPLTDTIAATNAVTRQQWSKLQASRINTIRSESQGLMTLNAETLAFENDLININVRRLMILLRRLALQEGEEYVFDNNDEAFRDRVRNGFEDLLFDLFMRGAFAGDTADAAFEVVTDSSVNPPQSVERGRFIVELRVAPSEPMRFMIVRLIQSGPGQLTAQEV